MESQATDVIANLSPARVAAIKAEFDKRGGELDRTTFVCVLRAYLPDEIVITYDTLPLSSSEYGEPVLEHVRLSLESLVAILAELFDEVDANGEGHASWNEASFWDVVFLLGLRALLVLVL